MISLSLSHLGHRYVHLPNIQLVSSSAPDHLPAPGVHPSAPQLEHRCEDWQRWFLTIRRFYSTWLKSFTNSAAGLDINRRVCVQSTCQCGQTKSSETISVDRGVLAGAVRKAYRPRKYHFTFPRRELTVS